MISKIMGQNSTQFVEIDEKELLKKNIVDLELNFMLNQTKHNAEILNDFYIVSKIIIRKRQKFFRNKMILS